MSLNQVKSLFEQDIDNDELLKPLSQLQSEIATYSQEDLTGLIEITAE